MTTTGEQATIKRVESDGPRPVLLAGKEARPAMVSEPAYLSASALRPPAAKILPVAEESLIGTTIDKRFRVLSRLGKGGMSEVFKAEHLILQKPLAIKVLHPQEASKENSIERFQQEAKAISTLDHPNIVKVYAFGLSESNQLYLAMDFLDGPSLAEVLQTEGSLGWMRAVSLALQIVDGLEQAHNRGIIHRDLKPSNIIVQTGETGATGAEIAKIVDFGIARLTSESGKEAKQLTAHGNTCGSPPYMSPEQCLGESVDSRSDIYSFGCMMYELLSGKRPFVAGSSLEVMQMQVEQSPKFFKSICPKIQIPESLEAIIRKCMSKNPEFRYQTMADLQADLKTIGSDSLNETTLQKSLRRESRVPAPGSAKFSGVAKSTLLGCAGGAMLFAGAALAYFHFLAPSEVSQLSNQIAAISARDPQRMEKNFALLQRLIAYDGRTAGRDPNTSDHETVLLRLRELQSRVNALPVSLNKCRYQAGLVRFLVKLDKQGEAKKLASETLDLLEKFVGDETARAHPNKRMVEFALLEAVRLCGYDPDKQDRVIGKYNILSSIYLAEGRLDAAEHAAASAVAIIKSQVLPSPVAEISVRQNLASVLMREGKFKEAEAQLLQAWELCKKGWTLDCQFAKNVARLLANCYEAEGKKAEAAELIKQTNP